MVLELFGTEFKDKLFEELVSLNIKAMEEAKRRSSRHITWVPIKQLQEATGWGRTKLERVERPREISIPTVRKGREVSLQFGRCSAILSNTTK